jgi:serine/threonine protein kinase
LARVLEEYLAALEAGNAPDRGQLLARYPDLADVLADCLDGLEFIRGAAARVRTASEPEPTLVHAGQEGGELPLGDYRLVREIGRGGMGVVYEAEQLSLGRRVALKVLPFAAALDPSHLQRFKNEAQAAALLQHQNIVPVYGVGCERGVHFYAMQYIEGQSLAQLIADRRLQIADLQHKRGEGREARGEKDDASLASRLSPSLCGASPLRSAIPRR